MNRRGTNKHQPTQLWSRSFNRLDQVCSALDIDVVAGFPGRSVRRRTMSSKHKVNTSQQRIHRPRRCRIHWHDHIGYISHCPSSISQAPIISTKGLRRVRSHHKMAISRQPLNQNPTSRSASPRHQTAISFSSHKISPKSKTQRRNSLTRISKISSSFSES
ncbi:MAG: hypothetical protein BWX66_02108 [Deltaproteobacteria bacterium ADurb.Bin058]|nr:MAG: hypothetical protein BWX66_02108 [Deltaproteobacteria bacterium ADurb.Bin058]